MREAMPRTTLFLLRHAATKADLERPARVQGRGVNSPLDPLGVRQAELTRDLLALQPIRAVYTSPLRRAVQTARILAAPRGLPVQPLEALTDCDVGRWEKLTWEQIRAQDPEAAARFLADPAAAGYPEGETLAAVAARSGPALAGLLAGHAGLVVVVGHQAVHRAYLAGLMGLPPGGAQALCLEHCGVSVVHAEDGRAWVETLNATFHLQGARSAA
jgi:broad specificity phosphatase PhoE